MKTGDKITIDGRPFVISLEIQPGFWWVKGKAGRKVKLHRTSLGTFLFGVHGKRVRVRAEG